MAPAKRMMIQRAPLHDIVHHQGDIAAMVQLPGCSSLAAISRCHFCLPPASNTLMVRRRALAGPEKSSWQKFRSPTKVSGSGGMLIDG